MAVSVAPTTSTRPRWFAPVAVGAGLAVCTAYTAWQDPNADGVFPQCPTRTLFGVDCPGCGGLRAVHALTQLDVPAALSHNVVVALLVPIVGLLWLRWLLSRLDVKVPALPKVPKPAIVALFVAITVFSVVRNIEGVAAFEYLNSTT